jgi:hypothetical protein
MLACLRSFFQFQKRTPSQKHAGFARPGATRLFAMPAAGVSLTLSLLAGCGSSLNLSETLDSADRGATMAQKEISDRFTDDQIDAVYTDERGTDGKPVIKEPLLAFYEDQSQAPDLVAEFGSFTRAAEFWGHLNLARTPSQLHDTYFALTFEAISAWTRIRNRDGEALFTEAYATDAKGKRIPDPIDGRISNNDETQFGRLKMQISIASVTVDMKVRMQKIGTQLAGFIVNTEDISAPFVGTVIKKNNFRIKLELYPYRNGFLTYGVAAAKMEKLEDKLSPDTLGNQVYGMFNYLHERLIGK